MKYILLSFLILILNGCATLTPQQKLAFAINSEVNKVPYVNDIDNYNVDEYLAKPSLFYQNGGDCDD